jgi:D-alanine-D-alanine ligase
MTKKIAVLEGGLSSEREVSLNSGKAVKKALTSLGYEVVAIDAGYDLAQQLVKAKPDAAFIALHGTYGEDGCVQGLLEFMQIPYTHSSITASAIAMDKEMTQMILRCAGVSVARNYTGEIDEIAINTLPMPFVLKPVAEGSSVGVSIIRNEDDLKKAKSEWKYGRAMAEQFIDGHELSVAVLDNPEPVALGVIELKPKAGFYDYTNKYTGGKTDHIMPAPLSAEHTEIAKEMAVRAHKALKCSGASRTDIRFNGKEFFVLETNTHPGMTELSLLPEIANYAGITFPKLVEILVKNARLHKIKG